ncbi:YybH family protein [Nakamurella endophytica]|uniref:Ketosteroid isomerase n=1 Tax=Nakamurella endophytica TaxID=1748367 RepID=A0A917WBV6_9ACTN|nr:nuclear transport factor 2 family protein [Nakamurella endophytica]GGL89632.1 ketosteroid isomerase [Nakamurella endophytica]
MTAEDELRALVDERVRAVRDRDVATLAGRPVTDVLSFDVLPPLRARGTGPMVRHLQEWFDGYDGPIDYSVRDVEVTADADVGFCSFLYHVGGRLRGGDEVDMWVRATLGCRRVDGRWRIVHDHESVPFDPATGRALLSLHPDASTEDGLSPSGADPAGP